MLTVAAASSTSQLRSLIDKTLRERPTLINRVQGMYALVVMIVSYWRGRAVAQGARVIHKGQELERKLTTEPRWRLLPKAWAKRFSALEASAKTALDVCSITGFPVASAIDGESFEPVDHDEIEESSEGVFTMRGCRLVMSGQLAETGGRILAIRDQLLAAADELCDEETATGYQSIKAFLTEQFAGNQEGLLAALTCVPSPTALRGKFNIRIGRMPVGAYDSKDNSALELAVYNLEHMIHGPRRRLAEAVMVLATNLVGQDSLGDLVHREKRFVNTKSINALRREIMASRSFAEVLDQNMNNKVDALERRLDSLGPDAADAAEALRNSEDEAMVLAIFLHEISHDALDINQMMAAAEHILATI